MEAKLSPKSTKPINVCMKFRATARVVARAQEPKGAAALLSSLIREGATGIEALIRLDVPLRRTYNSLVYAAMFLVTLVLIYRGFRDYCHYQVSTSMELVDTLEGALLPAVTICNINGFKKSVFCAKENLVLTDTLCKIDDKSLFAGLFLNMSFEPDRYDKLRDIAELSTFAQDDLIERCYLKHLPCPPGIVTDAVVSYPRYGRCYCFFCNHSSIDDSARFTQSSRLEEGLSLVLNSHRHDMMDSTKSSGFVVMLHDRSALPDVTADGFYIIDGQTSFAGVSYDVIERLPAPYATKCRVQWPPEFDSPPFTNLTQKMPYATSLCIKVCYSQYILNKCSCRQSLKLTYRDFLDVDALCMDTNETQICRNELAHGTIACDCPPRCDEKVYRANLSGGRFTDWNITMLGNHDDNSTYSRLMIYYHDVTAQTFVEVEAINRVQLMNLLGGNFGMFVGASFLILYELLEINIRWLLKLVMIWHESHSVKTPSNVARVSHLCR